MGTALHALEDDTSEVLDVCVTEVRPFMKGTDLDKVEKIALSVKNMAEDGVGAPKMVTLKDHLTINRYFGSMFNMRRPNVGKGEYVGCIGLGNSAELLWFPLGYNNHVRLEECLELFIANKTEAQANDPNSLNNCYVLKMDTREGRKGFSLTTNKNKGEEVSYALHILTESGLFTLRDSKGNSISLDSKNDTWTIVDAIGDKFTMGKRVSTLDTNTFNVNAAQSNFNGNVRISQLLDVIGMTTLQGGAIVTNTLTVNGATTLNGSVNVTGITNCVGAVNVTGTVTASMFADTTGIGVWHKP